jgi:hypothetical protein
MYIPANPAPTTTASNSRPAIASFLPFVRTTRISFGNLLIKAASPPQWPVLSNW